MHKEGQQLPGSSADFFSDDETLWVKLLGFQSTADAVMVGDHQPVDLLAPAFFQQRLRAGQAIVRIIGVAVEFDA